jgi:ribosomal protein S18 acetylase RimI-like enzyme
MNLRQATKSDLEKIVELHRRAAETANGIARTPAEVTTNYVADFLHNALAKGLIFVAENPHNSQKLIAEIHCYKFDPACFQHTLANLTLVVHPDFQGHGVGKAIFSRLLDEIKSQHPNIARVELTVRQSNPKAIGLYQKLGFKIEGICENRILNAAGELDGDTMMGWMNPNFKFLPK